MNSLPQTWVGMGNVPTVESETVTGKNPGLAGDQPEWHAHSWHESGAYRLRFQNAVPKYLSAAAVDPFRQLGRPLAHWLAESHFAVPGEGPEADPVSVPLKSPSLLVVTLAVILGPIIFVMLLPLLLILLPAFLVIGFLGLLAAAISFEPESPRLA